MSLTDLIRQGRGVYWLLNCCCEEIYSISSIRARSDGRTWLFPKHGLNNEQIADALLRLQAEGWMLFGGDEGLHRLEKSQFQSGLRGEPPFNEYMPRLTEAGGNAWESMGHPDWSEHLWHYIQLAEHDYESEPEVDRPEECQVVEGTDLDWIQLYVKQLRTHLLDGSLGRADLNTICVETVEPYRPKDWKTLAKGFRVSFQWLPRDDGPMFQPEIEDLQKNLWGDSGWYRRRWLNR